MRRRRRESIPEEEGHHVIGDLFAGFLIAVLLVLLVVLVQTLVEAQQIRKLRKINEIVQRSINNITSNEYVKVESGEIILTEEMLFESARWNVQTHDTTKLEKLVNARSELALLLDDVGKELSLEGRSLLEAHTPEDLLEVHVFGHTDCIPLQYDIPCKEFGFVGDNIDLSSLRAAAVVRFLTEPCMEPAGGVPMYSCCPPGLEECDSAVMHHSIDPMRWSVVPGGRSFWEPRNLPVGVPYSEAYCDREELGRGVRAAEFSAYSGVSTDEEVSDALVGEAVLQHQRRVAIRIVPRFDRLLVHYD